MRAGRCSWRAHVNFTRAALCHWPADGSARMIGAASWLRRQQRNEVGRSDTHRRVVAGLAFVAIWLTSVSPVISRVWPLWGTAPATSDMACAEPMGHATDPDGQHPHLPSTDRCGYCALVGHSPFLAEAAWLPTLLPQV